METVTFPFVNLTLQLNPIAFKVWNIPVYWYAIIIVASMVLALFLCYKKSGKFGITFETILDLSLWLFPISFIGARLYYVLFNSQDYLDWTQIFNIKDGGLAIYGGIIAGAIVCYFFCKKRKINLWNLLDYLVPYLALAQCLGRFGNFINVEAYGTATQLPWKMGIFLNGEIQYVHPTFLYESIATFFIFILLSLRSRNRRFSGEITYLYLILYSFARFFIEGLRIDSLYFMNFRVSQIISAILFVLFCWLLSKKLEMEKITKTKRAKTVI